MRALMMIRNLAGRSALVVGFLLPWSTGVAGQDRTVSAPPQGRLVELFSSLAPHQSVQIVTPVIFLDDAGYMRVGPDSVEVSWQGSTVPVSLDHIRVVSVRSGHALQGALWGAGAGLLVGSVSGLIIGSFACKTPQTCSDSERRGLIRLGGALGFAGGALGFVLGGREHYWKPVFP